MFEYSCFARAHVIYFHVCYTTDAFRILELILRVQLFTLDWNRNVRLWTKQIRKTSRSVAPVAFRLLSGRFDTNRFRKRPLIKKKANALYYYYLRSRSTFVFTCIVDIKRTIVQWYIQWIVQYVQYDQYNMYNKQCVRSLSALDLSSRFWPTQRAFPTVFPRIIERREKRSVGNGKRSAGWTGRCRT